MMSRHALSYPAKAFCVCLAIMAYTKAVSAQLAPSPDAANEPRPIPLPDRNPARLSQSLHPSQIKVADWTAQDIQAAMDRCGMMLAGTGVVYRHLAPLRDGQCGTPAPIELSAIGSSPSVAITPPARVTCGLAASLSAWSDTILQPAARMHLGETITGIRNVASYVCRNRYNAPDKRISEHARANALDMAAFKTNAGNWITVLEDWGLPPELRTETPVPQVSGVTATQPSATSSPSSAPTPVDKGQATSPVEHPEFSSASAFLFGIHKAACSLFGTVLGPEANDAHKDHFHYDLAERSHSNYCE